jgi:hypothetical protein
MNACFGSRKTFDAFNQLHMARHLSWRMNDGIHLTLRNLHNIGRELFVLLLGIGCEDGDMTLVPTARARLHRSRILTYTDHSNTAVRCVRGRATVNDAARLSPR